MDDDAANIRYARHNIDSRAQRLPSVLSGLFWYAFLSVMRYADRLSIWPTYAAGSF
ncbi:hypothetical protein KCP75_15955 [Salmonella enterica subsp. enterica]|nr:hypothetical protein KCP75_15955 [Salmonella enterica subsp. enterica]